MSTIENDKNLWYKASHGFAPPGTVVGGQDSTGEPIYVARAIHEKDIIPGKLIASHGCAFISWNGEEIRKTEYEVLVGNSNNWLATSDRLIPSEAFHGGQIYGGEKLFVGRVHHEGSLTTGKVQKTHGVCYIPYGDKNLWYKASHGFAPPGTVVGGQDSTGEPIYVARAIHEKDIIPGKLIASHGCAFISWNGEEIRKTEYEVLVGNSNNWLATSDRLIPSEAFHGGQIYGGEKLFVGRVHHEGSLTTGKVQKTHGVCYIPYGDKNLWYKASHGFAPPGTVVGGQDSTGEPIYVARAIHEKDIIPGKLIASHGCAFISWNGEEIRKTEYEVLVGNSNNWLATSDRLIPSEAFHGGQIYGGEKLFVGRVHHEGSLTTGKVQKTHGVCYIPYGGKELRFTEYEILTN